MPEKDQRDFAAHPPEVMDYVTFRASDDRVLAGYVAAVRRCGGVDAWMIWVEQEEDSRGCFCPVAGDSILSSDHLGAQRRRLVDEALWQRLALCDFPPAEN